MTEEIKPTEQELLQKAVEEAAALPVPEPKAKEIPYLHAQASFRKGLRNLFRTGKKKAKALEAKKDAEGNPLVHGNGGAVYQKAVTE